ncbi:hypothetical protein [Butyrivibrio sp. INlla16]|uniref:hypothetical protein n=1 Tax=Butyrivibrio sp. INlla16 TaxID=1520807 RepID=UPI00088944EF|nr:hypothetical protein [Butyrivibrio sp. INlla16]SDB66085.1 hypothetical protein SAMN02910263_03796 [Butyrivibrio sp. INlla16]
MNEEITVLNQETLPLTEMIQPNEETVEEFSYEGYEVVRGEFFAHLFEPSVTFKDEKVYVNVACLRKLPEVEYVQFLVNPEKKKLAVKPCSEDTKDSFKWATGEDASKRKPKQITCRIFFAKVLRLMGWSSNYKYKVLGKLIRTDTDQIFVFDLNCAETYRKKKAGEEVNTREALYPESWENQFGIPATEHQDTVQISIFDEYTVFRINRDEEEKGGTPHEDTADSDIAGSEEGKNQDTQADTAEPWEA